MDAISLALLALGLLLAVLEVFVPSMGALAVSAAGAIIGGAVVAYQRGSLFLYCVIAFLALPIAVAIAFKLFPKTRVGRALTLAGPTFRREEARASESGLDRLIGLEGVAETALRPAGIATIAERRVDVVTRGEHIGVGEKIRVIKVEGNRVIVDSARGL
ncbi:MAG: NfeD family protein [Planctomycetota bacterium]